MLNIQVSTLTLLLGSTDCVFHGKLISLSHRLGFARHYYYDGTRRGNV